MRYLPTSSAVALSAVGVALAGENAAPSSHLVFDDNFPGDIIVNEVRVPADGEARFTYYETLGWRGKAGGYAGIQAHPKARNYIFSIWDHKEHTAPIRAVHRSPGTLTEKFGGEGTGLKSWNFELGWELDVWYTLVSRCWPVGDHTYFGFWVRSGETGEWTHLVTMDVAVAGAKFEGGNDAFIEDWLETGKNKRTSHLRGAWRRKLDGSWHAAESARYSVNYWDLEPSKRSFNFRTAWDGGVAEDETGKFYYMTAGGEETKPSTGNPSRHSIARNGEKPSYAPIGISSAGLHKVDDGGYVARWEVDPKAAPMFSYQLHYNGELKREVIEPHAREAEVVFLKGVFSEDVRLVCRDIFGNESESVELKLR